MSMPYSTDSELVKLIYYVAHKCVVLFEDKFKLFGITFPQAVLLLMLYEMKDKDLCQKDIEKLFGVKGSSISSLVNNMCKKGYIQRKSCESDGRKYIIKATEDGDALCKKFIDDNKDFNFSLFDKLSDDEKHQLMGLLLKIN